MSGITGASPTNITGAHIPPTVGKEVKEKEPLLSPHSSSLSSLSSGSPLTPAPLILPDIHADFSSGFERLREEAMFTDVTLTVRVLGDSSTKSYPAHRLILSLSSNLLDRILRELAQKEQKEKKGRSLLLLSPLHVDLELDRLAEPHLAEVLRFCYSGQVSVSLENVVALKHLALKLEVAKLELMIDHFLSGHLNKQTVPQLLNIAAKLKVQAIVDQCIAVFARHFSHFIDTVFDFRLLSLDHMIQLLQHPALFAESEDILYDTVHHYASKFDDKKPQRNLELFSNVRFVNLSLEKLDHSQRSDLVPKELVNEALVARLAAHEGRTFVTQRPALKRRNSYGRVCEYQAKDFDTSGIIYYLATNGVRDPWKNPQERGRLAITMSSVEKGKVEAICDLTPKEMWSHDIPSSWMAIDLGKGRAVKASRYALRHGGNSKQDCLRNWVLTASNDAHDWVTLKRHKMDESLNGPFATSSWDVEAHEGGPWRHFRIVQTGHNSSSHNFLSISGIELYGELYLSKNM